MSQDNEHFTNFILILIVGGVVVGTIVYLLFWFWPYFVYYILPFALATFVIGWVLRIAIAHMEGGGQIEGSYSDKQYHPLVSV